MQQSVMYWLTVEYASTGLGEDASPASKMEKELKRLAARWQKTFDTLANWLGTKLVDRVQSYTDKAQDFAFKAKGFAVPFNMTPFMENAYKSVQVENIGLIKTIPQECLAEVQGLVMRSVARGRDLATLTDELQDRFKVTRSRAKLIARDQNNKATATMVGARQQSLGITEGIWRHSHAGKTPRPSHVAANGKKFDLAKGMYLDGKWVMPAEEINCRCTWSAVIKGFID